MTRHSAICVALFCSGLAALMHELMWVRLLGRMFGHTIFAVQTVLTVFFLGLAAGAWLVSRMRIERPLAAFAFIEVGIAAWGAAMPLLIPQLTRAYDRFAAVETETASAFAARLLVTLVALIIPTTLMGATFPLVAAALRRVSTVYAVNTLGGAAGVWLTAFLLLPMIGVVGVIVAAAILNIVAAVIAAIVHRLPDGTEQRPRVEGPLRRAALILFMTGFSALALQFLWTRALEQILSGTVYTFAVVLGVFLAGIGLGALILQRLTPSRALLSYILGLLAVAVLLTPAIIRTISSLPVRGALAETALASALLLIPTTLMGMTFPLLIDLGRGSIGGLTAANTAGSVAGPIAAGVLLLPHFGLRTAIVFFAVLTASLCVFAAERRRTAMAFLGVVLLSAFFVAPQVRGREEPGEVIVASRDDIAATVAVVRNGEEQRLKVNNSYSLGGGRGVFTERRQGHIPMLLHPDPRRVLVLGVGTGNTLAAVAQHRPERLLAVDLLPGVVELAAGHFSATNHDVLRNRAAAEVHVADATRVVRSSREEFDVVIGDLFHPWQAGVGSLYSLEHFRHVSTRLASGGMFVQWLPLYQLSKDDVRTVTRTFLAAFPHAEAWLGNFGSSTPIVALVGSNEAMRWSEARWRRAVGDPSIASALAEVYLNNPVELYASFVCERALLERFAGAGPLNRETEPVIEFSAARALFDDRFDSHRQQTVQELVELAAAQDRYDRLRGARDATWFENRLGIRAFIVSFLALGQGNAEAAAEAAIIAAEKCTAYDLPRRTLAVVGYEILPANPVLAERVFRAALKWNPEDSRAREGLLQAMSKFDH